MLALLEALDPKAPPAGVDPYAWISYAGVVGMFAALMAMYWYSMRQARKEKEDLLKEIRRQSDEKKEIAEKAIASEKESALLMGRMGVALEESNRLHERTANALEGAGKELADLRQEVKHNRSERT